MSEVHRVSVGYPGGLAARYRWGGSRSAADVFALSEQGGTLSDHGALVSEEPDRMCRAEMRIEGPLGDWTARFASPIFDEPSALYWDTEGLLVVKYGFCAYAIEGRTGELRWWHQSGTPIIAVLGSSRLAHLLLQSEVETIALGPDGSVVWRVAHSDVVTAADLIGGTLALTEYGGDVSALDPSSGRPLPR